MRRALSSFVLAAVAALSSFGCSNTPNAPTAYAPFSQADLVVGTGAVATAGETVNVNYTGWLYDPSQPDNKGPQFDSTTGRGPFSFQLGASQVIQGWEQGVPGMREGGTRRLIIPPSLAYGAARSGAIPPYATLVFDIQLVSIAPTTTP